MNKFDGLWHSGSDTIDPTTGQKVQPPLSTAQTGSTDDEADGLVLYPNGLIMDKQSRKPVIYDDYNGMSSFTELMGHDLSP